MSSQEDIFATQEPPPTPKKVEYEFVVLCDKDEGAPEPFSLYPRSMFLPNEIHGKWLDSILDDSSRLKSLHTLQRFPETNLSLFAKIENGTYYYQYFLSSINIYRAICSSRRS